MFSQIRRCFRITVVIPESISRHYMNIGVMEVWLCQSMDKSEGSARGPGGVRTRDNDLPIIVTWDEKQQCRSVHRCRM